MSDGDIETKNRNNKKIENQKISKADIYLRGYEAARKLLSLDIYEENKNTTSEWRESGKDRNNDMFLARARMFDIRHRIMDLPNGDEKLLLYYHYIKGEPIDRCSDLLGLSRSTAFRLRRKGLVMIYDAMNKA